MILYFFSLSSKISFKTIVFLKNIVYLCGYELKHLFPLEITKIGWMLHDSQNIIPTIKI